MLLSTSALSVRTADNACIVSQMSDLSNCLSSTNIIINNLAVPGGQTLDLTKLHSGTTLSFEGIITFGHWNWAGPLVSVKGDSLTICGTGILDGQGALYWDGKGGNGGVTKPKFFKTSVTNSIVRDITLLNTPVQAFSVQATNTQFINVTVNNAAGMSLAHNTDGIDINKSSWVSIINSTVISQDDCVVVGSGSYITVTNMHCMGATHGLSVRGQSDPISNIVFQDSILENASIGARLKTVSGGSTTVSDVTWRNIFMTGITKYAIDIQQDYLNGGPTGKPTNGVKVSGITFSNIGGDLSSSCTPIYILCGQGSCSGITLAGTSFHGGKSNSCNIAVSGC